MTYRVYAVGGCVRDQLLRQQGMTIPEGDRDWVVVGATPDALLAQGFVPVGADFPVFLHPKTHEEYALARTERKTAAGYHGFTFYAAQDVTLEEDLRRRDLTINAIAQDADGTLIDPYGGVRDVAARVFRHVSEAFAEDPVRILRVARFSARLPMFDIAPETMALMQSMVENGEADALVPERVWAEMSRGLMEKKPSKMIRVLDNCGYLSRSLTELKPSDAICLHLDSAADAQACLAVRTALLVGNMNEADAVKALLTRLRAPKDVIDTAQLVTRIGALLHHAKTAEDYVRIFENADLLRRPERFELLLQAAGIRFGALPLETIARLSAAFRGVDAGRIARELADKRLIATAVAEARLANVRTVLNA